MNSLQGESSGVLSWRAPHGSLDFRQFDAVWASLQPGAEWKARIDKANAQMARENDQTQRQIAQIRDTQRETMAHIARRGQISAQTQKDIADIRNDTYQSTWMSYNAALRARALGYLDVQCYRGGIEAWKAAGLPLQSPNQR